MKREEKEEVLKALRELPVVSSVCQKCGISRQTFYRWRDEDSDFYRDTRSAIRLGESYVNDVCESQMLNLIKNGKFQVIRYWLEHHHDTYMPPSKKALQQLKVLPDMDEIMQRLKITEADLVDETLPTTLRRIEDYIDGL